MPADSAATHSKQQSLRFALAAIVVGMAIYITYVAATARVEQYDGYVYLNNAKRILDLPPAKFEHYRPPLISLAMLASVRLAAAGPPANIGYFLWPHLAAVVISLLSALAVGLLLRRHSGTTLALVGVTFFVTSRLFIRYGPFVMADLLSAGLVALVLAAYLRTWTDGQQLPAWRDYRFCGLLLGAALLGKQSLGLILPALVLSEILHAIHFRRWQSRRLWGLALTIGIGVLVFLSVELLIFTWLYGADALEAAAYTAKNDFHPRSVANRLAASTVGDSNWNYATLAWQVFSPPVILAGALGLGLALKQRQARDLPFLAWLAVLGGTITCLLRHTEARYLLPAVPMWLYFVLRAMEAIADVVRRFWSKSRPWRLAVIAAACVSVISLAATSLKQIRLNDDAFYTADSHRRTLRSLLAAREAHGRLRWFGPLATFYPAHRANLKGDDYFDIFHLGADSLEYFTSEPVVPVEQIAGLGDGDAVLKAPDIYYRNSSIPPEGVPPPQIWTARVLTPSIESAGGSRRMQTPDGSIGIGLAASRGYLALRPEEGIGSWHVYVKLPDGTLEGGDSVDFRDGQSVVLDAPDTTPVAGLLLMRM
jgi:4-amino-4-deoxy-L-arabinose transferase-like glycosyltransferase